MRLSPKEKAEELIRKYYSFGLNNVAGSFSWYQCKKFALFTVDEILNAREVSPGGLILDEDYWLEVKEELINWKNE